MKKDIIFNLKSLFVIKYRTNISLNSSFFKKTKIIKINNTNYLKDRTIFKITKNIKEIHSLKTLNSMNYNKMNILINHTIFNFYTKKYNLKNKYVISNISEIYRLTKSFIKMFNLKYISDIPNEIRVNHDTVFTIIKYNENKINDIEKYKNEKVENIFDEELFSIIRGL